jgi:hypothetical protein
MYDDTRVGGAGGASRELTGVCCTIGVAFGKGGAGLMGRVLLDGEVGTSLGGDGLATGLFANPFGLS